MWQSLLFLLMVTFLIFPNPGLASISDASGLIQVISPKASIKIDSVKGLTMKAGDTLPLFQENEKYFIALAEDKYGEPTLAAFARKDFQNRASAWVTAQKSLVFAREASARSGKMYLRKGENLPVLQEHRKTYEVMISRYGNDHRMEISRKLSGIHYRPGAELPPELLPKEPQVKKITLADLPPTRKIRAPAAPKPKVHTSASKLRNKSSSFLAATMKKVGSLFETESRDVVHEDTHRAEDDVDRTVYYRPKDAYPNRQPEAETKIRINLLYALQEHSAAINILLVVLIIIAIYYARNQRITLPNQATPSPDEQDKVVEPPEMPLPLPQQAEAKSDKPPAFTGSLDVFNIKNLVQFLHNSSSTGVLNIEVEGVSDPGRVILNMGEVKHATYNGLEGQAAFLEIFSLDRGLFRFKLSQQIKTKETIHTETSQLIDETAKIVEIRNKDKIIQFGQAAG